jgi:hypothetical protein
MPLANTSNGRIAGHLPERLDCVRQEKRARARPGGSQRRFRTGVATTDDNHVETGRKIHGN